MSRFIDRFQLIVGTGLLHGKSILASGWFSYPRIMFSSIGWFPFIIGLAAVVYIIVRRQKKDILMLSFIVVFYLFSGGWKLSAGHYILPLYPFFAIISARFVFWLSERIKENSKRKYFIYGVIFLLIVTTLPKIIRTDYILSKKDTRLITYEWFMENIPEGSRVLRQPFTPEFKGRENYQVKVDWDQVIKDKPIEELNMEYDYVLVSNFNYKSESDFERRLNEGAVLIKEISGKRVAMFHNPRIRIYKIGIYNGGGQRPQVYQGSVNTGGNVSLP